MVLVAMLSARVRSASPEKARYCGQGRAGADVATAPGSRSLGACVAASCCTWAAPAERVSGMGEGAILGCVPGRAHLPHIVQGDVQGLGCAVGNLQLRASSRQQRMVSYRRRQHAAPVLLLLLLHPILGSQEEPPCGPPRPAASPPARAWRRIRRSSQPRSPGDRRICARSCRPSRICS